MPVRTGIRISALQSDLDELTRVDISSTSTTATISTEGTKDLILNTNEGTNSGTITIEDGTSGDIKLATQNEVHLTGGNVGIGTTSPAKQLHLYGASGEVEFRIQSDTSFCSIVQKDNNEMIIQNAASGGVMIFHDDTAERMRIDSDGDATFAGDVTVTGEVIASAGIDVKNGDTGAGYINFYEDSDNGTNSVTVIGPASTGDVTLTLPSATDTLVGKATTDTLTNKTLTSPVLTTPRIADDGYIADGAGNEQLEFVQTTDATDFWSMTNAAAGSPILHLECAGSDTNVAAIIKPKGTGYISFDMQHADGEVRIMGTSGASAKLALIANAAGGNDDKWVIDAADGGVLAFQSKISSSYVDILEITPNSTATSSETAITGSLELNSGTAAVPGAGVGNAASISLSVAKVNDEIVTTILVDIAGLLSTGTIDRVLSDSGETTAAYLTRITTAVNGIVYRAEMACIEEPAVASGTLVADIDLVANDQATLGGAEDWDDTTGGAESTSLIAAGTTWEPGMCGYTASMKDMIDLPTQYLYLSCGAGTSANSTVYSEGKFIIKLYGASF